jgi:hypothetical protein
VWIVQKAIERQHRRKFPKRVFQMSKKWIHMSGLKMVRNPEIDEPWLRKAGEVPAALSFKEALRAFVLHIRVHLD